jgi:hypothetical protein
VDLIIWTCTYSKSTFSPFVVSGLRDIGFCMQYVEACTARTKTVQHSQSLCISDRAGLLQSSYLQHTDLYILLYIFCSFCGCSHLLHTYSKFIIPCLDLAPEATVITLWSADATLFTKVLSPKSREPCLLDPRISIGMHQHGY